MLGNSCSSYLIVLLLRKAVILLIQLLYGAGDLIALGLIYTTFNSDSWNIFSLLYFSPFLVRYPGALRIRFRYL